MKALKPGERVLLIGATSEPQLCAKKDESALVNAFQKHVHMPMPDYASRQILWPGLVAKHGAAPDASFDWPTLAQISANYSSGQLDQVVASLLSEQRLERLQKGGAGGGADYVRVHQLARDAWSLCQGRWTRRYGSLGTARRRERHWRAPWRRRRRSRRAARRGQRRARSELGLGLADLDTAAATHFCLALPGAPDALGSVNRRCVSCIPAYGRVVGTALLVAVSSLHMHVPWWR